MRGSGKNMRQRTGKIIFSLAVITTAAIPLLSQTPPTQKPSFEVASIKSSDPGNNRFAIVGQPGGRLIVTGASLKGLIAFAYAVRDFQISGGPNWITTDRWDIEARAEESTVPPPTGPPDPNRPNPLAIRLQLLLEDRFQLKVHRETREMPVFELTVAKGGPKVKLSDDQSPFKPPEPGTPAPPPPRPGDPMPRGGMSIMLVGGELQATAVPLSNFVGALSQILGRTVIDKTDLKGLYDFKLKWTPDVGQQVGPPGPVPPGVELPPVDPSGPSLVTALQDELGLKSESTKGPVEVIVIDSVEKPSEN
jgi:bla regulator protein blaR1